ncbi:MAG: sodium:solute symporter, partial [Verrucomicrobiota bacterium]
MNLGAQEGPVAWEKLQPLPDEHGFAGLFAGIIDQHLVVAGGANFPGKPPWENGTKVWHDRVFVFSFGTGKWTTPSIRLPEALAYGVSLSLPDRQSIAFLGGSARDNHPTTSAFEVRLQEGRIEMTPLPPLPIPLAESSGVALNNKLYLFSGRTTENTARMGFRLDLNQSSPHWEMIPWPASARGRVHSAAGVFDGKIHVVGGRDRVSEGDPDQATDRMETYQRDFLRDAWRLDPETLDWTRLADLPQGLSAAPQGIVPAGSSHFLLLGGVNVSFLEEQLAARPELNGQGHEHPGFPKTIWAYHTITNTWTATGELPADTFAPVTVPVIPLMPQSFIIPSGEIKPGVRSTQVLYGKIKANRAPFGTLNWTIVALYLTAMVGVGYWFMRNEAAASTDAYFRGGQRVPWWIAGLSIFATMLSAITFMAIPAKAYAENMNAWIGQWSMILIVPLVVVFYLPFFRKLDVTTAYQYLEERFNLASRLVASALFIFFHLGRVAIVLYLPALALSSATDIDIFVAIFAIGVLCILYTVMGGIEAVVWTDAIQALVLLGGALLCLLVIISRIDGGLGTILEIGVTDQKFLPADWGSFDVS